MTDRATNVATNCQIKFLRVKYGYRGKERIHAVLCWAGLDLGLESENVNVFSAGIH